MYYIASWICLDNFKASITVNYFIRFMQIF